MQTYPTNAEFLLLTATWKQQHKVYEGLPKEATAERAIAIRLRNQAATKILAGLDKLIIKLVNKRTYNDALREDAKARAQELLLSRGLVLWDSTKDNGKERSFLSYVLFWINRGIFDALNHGSSLIKTDTNKRREALKLKRQGKEIPEELRSSIPVFIYYNSFKKDNADIEQSGVNYLDYLCWQNGIITNTEEEERDIEQQVEALLKYIKEPRDRDIFVRRARGETLAEVGIRYNLSRERVRQIEATMFALVRHNLVREGKLEYLGPQGNSPERVYRSRSHRRPSSANLRRV